MGTEFSLKLYTFEEPCDSEISDLIQSVTSDQVDADRNIYFVQYGYNPNNLEPVNCAIDHDSIDWSAYDLTGGFGTYAEISYDENSFHGINFYKADN